jgi:hypothetical protein
MEELQTKTIDISLKGKTIACQFKERDFGDYIVYDVFHKNNYLFTISKDGDVLFNEADMTQQKTIMDPRELNELIEQVKDKIALELE